MVLLGSNRGGFRFLGYGEKQTVHILLVPRWVDDHETGQRAFDHNAWFSMRVAPFPIPPFFADLLRQQPVVFLDDGDMMPLNEILRFQAVVRYTLMREKVYRNCFLTQSITTILFVFKDAQDTAGTPNR